MNFPAIYHRSSEQMASPFDKDNLIINIKTGYDITQVFLIYGDPYLAGIMGGKEKWMGTRHKIEFNKLLKDHIWWTTTVKPEYKRCKYYFELHTKDEVYYLFADGFMTKEQMELPGKMLQYFIVPWMNPSDINTTPSWVNDTVWYQIFPDRFCRVKTQDEHNTEKIKEWTKGKVKNEDRYGGNLQGIISKLEYLKTLGISGIYLNPVCKAESNHKYDTTDYESIDRDFGTESDMIELVQKAHSLGIKIMMDGVFNHSGRNFAPWQDVLKNGRESKYFNWFMINTWPINAYHDTRDGGFYTFAFNEKMPKLNTNNKEVCDYIEKICLMWLEKYNIDGIRFDVGNEISHSLLKRLRSTLKAKKSDIYLLGEIWHDASQWLLGDEYDSVMNYPLTSSINDFFIDTSMTKKDFAYRINHCYTMYQQQSNNVLFNLLDSHDTDRLMNRTKNKDIFIQELALLFAMPGSVCIFYGTELGLEGAHDPDCRRCMLWDEFEDEERKDIFNDVKKLIALRKEESLMKSLYFHFTEDIKEERCIEFIKLDNSFNKIQILLNCSKAPLPILDNSEVLFSRGYKNQMLQVNGTLIRRL